MVDITIYQPTGGPERAAVGVVNDPDSMVFVDKKGEKIGCAG